MYTGVHNHCDTSNSHGFLDSINTIQGIFAYTQELGHMGVAITDHDMIGGHMEAINVMNDYKKKDPDKWKDYKLILGNEIYLCSKKQIEEDKHYKFYHFILLAKDKEGHRQLRELSTRAWTDNSFVWVNIRTPTYYDDLFEVVESNRGHLIGSTACLGGKLSELILQSYRENPESLDFTLAKKWLRRMQKCFGEGNFFLEMQPSNQNDQIIVNKAIVQLSEELNIPYIITTDSHYLKKEDRPIHEAFLNSNEDSGKDRELGEFYATTYIMSEAEIHSYMDESLGYEVVQKGIDNTMLIYDMVSEYTLEQPLNIPYEPDNIEEPNPFLLRKYSKLIPLIDYFGNSIYSSDRHLAREIINRIEERPEELANEETYQAIQTCLNVIKVTSDKMNTQWSAYLLQTKSFVDVIWESNSICGPARGSGGGFILLYILGIIQINPLREETPLYYWRFLHEYRASVLDVDLDCEGNKRNDIIANLQNKYGGYRRVSKVQTLLTMKAKNAILTACRGLGVSVEEAQFLSSFIGAERGIQYTLKQTFYGDEDNNLMPNKEFVRLMTNEYPQVWEVAQRIEGLISGIGQHAGGVILAPSDIVNYTALMRSSSGDIVTQFDLHRAEQAGQFRPVTFNRLSAGLYRQRNHK